MTDLRAYARGKPCQIRSPICNGNSDTVVLAHVRQIGVSGMGLKAPDLLGAWACSDCHRYVDQLTHGGRADRDLMMLKGVMRTQNQLIKDGVLTW